MKILKPIALILAIVLLCVGIYRLSKVSIAKPKHARHYNYTSLICDNAYTTARPPDVKSLYFDVKLSPGCFSGPVSVPKGWNIFGMQLLGKNRNDWVAFWFSGHTKAVGPFSYAQFNLRPPRSDRPLSAGEVSSTFRVQGIGTLRVYQAVPKK